MKRLLTHLSTRRCNGCADESFHTHHLTLLGNWRYVWSWAARRKVAALLP